MTLEEMGDVRKKIGEIRRNNEKPVKDASRFNVVIYFKSGRVARYENVQPTAPDPARMVLTLAQEDGSISQIILSNIESLHWMEVEE